MREEKKVNSFLRGKSADSVLSSEKSEIVCESFIIEMDGGEKESRSNQCLRGKSADSVLSSEKSEIICESFIIDTKRATRRKMKKRAMFSSAYLWYGDDDNRDGGLQRIQITNRSHRYINTLRKRRRRG